MMGDVPEGHGVTGPAAPRSPTGFREYMPIAIGPNGERIEWNGQQWVPIA